MPYKLVVHKTGDYFEAKLIDKLIGECHAMSLDRYLDTFYDRLYASVAVASSHNTINQKNYQVIEYQAIVILLLDTIQCVSLYPDCGSRAVTEMTVDL